MDTSRNWLFIDDALQKRLTSSKVLIAGLGIGSVFAEAALRCGISQLTIADGDQVDASNLNRQNYTRADVGKSKALACAERLRAVDPGVQLQVINEYLRAPQLARLIPEHDFVINTIDFDAPEFHQLTDFCQRFGKIELFPINLGFGASLTVLDASTPSWQEAYPLQAGSSLKEAILTEIASSDEIEPYLREAGQRYFDPTSHRPSYDSQLGVSTQMAAALMLTTIVRILGGDDVARFPAVHYLDAHGPLLLNGQNAAQRKLARVG